MYSSYANYSTTDVAVTGLVVTPSGTRRIYQDKDLKIELSITYSLSGQPLGGGSVATLGFTVLLSDMDSPTPSVGFNHGQELGVAEPGKISWQEDSLEGGCEEE